MRARSSGARSRAGATREQQRPNRARSRIARLEAPLTPAPVARRPARRSDPGKASPRLVAAAATPPRRRPAASNRSRPQSNRVPRAPKYRLRRAPTTSIVCVSSLAPPRPAVQQSSLYQWSQCGYRSPFPRDRLMIAPRAAALRSTSFVGCNVRPGQRPERVIWAAASSGSAPGPTPLVAFASGPAAP